MNTLFHQWKKLIQAGLDEDAVAFDWTARSLPVDNTEHRAQLIAKANGVWCGNDGLQAVQALSHDQQTPVLIHKHVKDGERVTPKTVVAEWIGPAHAIVQFERTLINLAAFTSGIATQTQGLVDLINQQSQALGLKNVPRLTPTRKTLPTYRDLSLQAVLCAGAFPHRYNLSGGLLLKENHIAAAGGILKAIQCARRVAPHLLKIEIEVRDFSELRQALEGGAEVIMLDNFSPDQVREAIAIKPKNTCFEVSGGINAQTIKPYVIEGVDVISVGSITHSVKALDLSLLMQ